MWKEVVSGEVLSFKKCRIRREASARMDSGICGCVPARSASDNFMA